MTAVAYTNNGVLLCIPCVERFDLTNPAERDPADEFLAVDAPLMDANIAIFGTVFCGSPVCDTVWTNESESTK